MSDSPLTALARRAQLGANLAATHARIEAARAAYGRTDPVHLVVVTKNFPASDVDLLADLGVSDVGENRDQEGSRKYAEVAARALSWHFIGQLQSNKAASVARWADVVHSVDRARLVPALDRGASRHGRRLRVLVQVSLDGASGRGGALPDEVPTLAALIAASEHLDLAGVMAVAPLGADPWAAFRDLADIARALRQDHPDATWISAGMSADLEPAVAAGATHLRVGIAILGSRPSLG